MVLLTREVRFAINPESDGQLNARPSNSYAGYPSSTGLGYYFTLQVTLGGELDPVSNYLQNIKHIDAAVRRKAIPLVEQAVRTQTGRAGPGLLLDIAHELAGAWPGLRLEQVRLAINPFLSLICLPREHPMIRLSQKFEFSAAHRLSRPELSEAENLAVFGKCSNPNGHGHNYEVQVTIAGHPDDGGSLVHVPDFERVVARTVVDRFDHKHLNLDVPEFHETLPTVENIARVIYRLLRPALQSDRVQLASVIVWESAKTWCEYSEP